VPNSLAARGQGVGAVQQQLTPYAQESEGSRKNRGTRRVSVYIGVTVLLAAALLVAVNTSRDKTPSPIRLVQPKAAPTCTTPPDGFLWSKTVDDTTFQVCISQEGNINQIWYPHPADYLSAISLDGYCLQDGTSSTVYRDFSAAGVSTSGFGPATLTVGPSSNNYNPIIMTRSTLDGRWQLSEYIKINFQPRSVFVGMTVKNIDTTDHYVQGLRFVRPTEPALPTYPSEYNEYGQGSPFGRTGQARPSGTGAGRNSLLFGPTQGSGLVLTQKWVDFQGAGGSGNRCSYQPNEWGLVTGGDRVFVGGLFPGANPTLQLLHLAPGESGSIGKFVYRMV
jgi:hypothetical protein